MPQPGQHNSRLTLSSSLPSKKLTPVTPPLLQPLRRAATVAASSRPRIVTSPAFAMHHPHASLPQQNEPPFPTQRVQRYANTFVRQPAGLPQFHSTPHSESSSVDPHVVEFIRNLSLRQGLVDLSNHQKHVLAEFLTNLVRQYSLRKRADQFRWFRV